MHSKIEHDFLDERDVPSIRLNKSDHLKPHILVTTSWMPTLEQPFLGNFIVQYAQELSQYCQVSLLQLIPDAQATLSIESKKELGLTTLQVRIPSSSKFLQQSKALKAVKAHLMDMDQPIDLIHHHVSVTKWWLPLYLKKALNCPVVVTEHASIFLNGVFSSLSPIMKFGVKQLYRQAEVVVGVSDQLTQALPQTNTDKQTIPNLLPVRWLTAPIEKRADSPYSFLHISTVDDNKQIRGILQAILQLSEQIDDSFSLTIISDESLEELKELAKSLKIDHLVHFDGPKAHHELLPIYQRHHCFVLNSKVETFSIVNAEALASGLHLISTPVGFAATLRNNNVDLIDSNGPLTSLVKHMQTAITQQKFGGADSRQLAQQFAAPNVIEQYLSIYQKAIESRNK